VLRVILWVVSGGVMLIEVTCEGPGAVRELWLVQGGWVHRFKRGLPNCRGLRE
jgi:hypothetical protein